MLIFTPDAQNTLKFKFREIFQKILINLLTSASFFAIIDFRNNQMKQSLPMLEFISDALVVSFFV